jgi:hypothetical protein
MMVMISKSSLVSSLVAAVGNNDCCCRIKSTISFEYRGKEWQQLSQLVC